MSIDEYWSWHCYVRTLKTEVIINLNQVDYENKNHDKYELTLKIYLIKVASFF